MSFFKSVNSMVVLSLTIFPLLSYGQTDLVDKKELNCSEVLKLGPIDIILKT